MNRIKLIDYVKVDPDPSLAKLSVREKVSLIDSIVSESETKGLYITYDLSHSGRRINNRIYTTKGQQKGINTLLSPYPKPILTHHDGGSDPIGRFTDGRWEDLSAQAMSFFDNVQDYMSVRKSFDSDDPERIFKSLKQHNLLTNTDWPGLGRMRVQAKITDQKAIEKFLDGRYVTFSAGSTTDRHVCSVCLSDWAQGDLCEHRHGKIYDGDLCVFVTGEFQVVEGSVVNMPADDLSQVSSMELVDQLASIMSVKECAIDKDTIYLSDSIYNFTEKNMPEHETKATEPVADEPVSVEASSSEDVDVKTDAAEDISAVADSITETSDESDKDTAEDTSEVTTEATTELKAEATTENTDSNEPSPDKPSDEGFDLKELDSLVKKLGAMLAKTADKEEVSASDAEEQPAQEDDQTSDEAIDDLDVDWYILDLALNAELGDAKLSTEKRNELGASTFCGPDRSFPVPDSAHATAARRLIGRAKLSSDQKSKVLACVSRKLKSLDCDSASAESNTEETGTLSNEEFKNDYIKALTRIEMLEASLATAIKTLASHAKRDSEIKNDELEPLCDWLNAFTSEDNSELQQVDNPSAASSDNMDFPSKKKDELGRFEQQIVDKYIKVIETNGIDAAENWFLSQRGYLPRGFHPNNFKS